MLDPVIEYKRIAQWLGRVSQQKLTPKQFVHRLGIFLNKHHSIRVGYEYAPSLDLGEFTIGAQYNPDQDEEGLKPFQITLLVNKKAEKLWEITGEMAERMSIELVEALVHEYRHLYQFRSRGFIQSKNYYSTAMNKELRAEQEYLGHTDEIDAYAANIAAKFFLIEMKLVKAKNFVSLDLGSYYKVFGSGHPVVKQLIKKIVRNIQLLHSWEHHTEQ